MVRKTDAELLAELKKEKRDREDEEEADTKKYLSDEEDADEEKEDKSKPPIQIVEREVNLSLINDKLNFIISKLTNQK
jgi:hypothetical protein